MSSLSEVLILLFALYVGGTVVAGA